MNTASPVFDEWLISHAYLKGAARFHQTLEDILSSMDIAALPVPRWGSYSDSLGGGIPLLGNMDLGEGVMREVASLLPLVVSRLSHSDCSEEVRRSCAALDEEMQRSPETALRIVQHVTAGAPLSLETAIALSDGLSRLLIWRTMEHVVRPWREELASWLADARWAFAYCPLCGELPAMAQLVSTDRGRERFLSCGCCRTRWRFRRIGCVFCGTEDQSKMEVLEMEEEEGFRIDVCHECKGYLKTCMIERDDSLMLADWSTLHLDVIALERGLQRRANSLYVL